MSLETGVAYLFAIIGFVLALNIYFMFVRFRRGSRRRRVTRASVDEAKQALWRDKEIARRIEREDEDALERVKLRNETLALYDEVRRRHAKDNEFQAEETTLVDEYDHVGWGSFYSSDEQDKEIAEADIEDLDPFDIFRKKK